MSKSRVAGIGQTSHLRDREKQEESERERDRQIQTDRQRQGQWQREAEAEAEAEADRQRQTDRHADRQTDHVCLFPGRPMTERLKGLCSQMAL